MTELTPNLFAIEVPIDAINVYIKFVGPYFHIGYYFPPGHEYTAGGLALNYKGFGGKNNYPKDLKLIGTIDAEKIYYDPYPFNVDSFRSLLASKGLHWVNPLGEEPKYKYPKNEIDVINMGNIYFNWRTAHEALIKGKLVIIEKI